MIVGSSSRIWKTLLEFTTPLLSVTVYVFAIAMLDLQYGLEQYSFSFGIITVMGTVIGLLLAFRTNASYGRWWEARKLWGNIVNDSRTWTRQLLEFSVSTNEQGDGDLRIERMSLRQVAWCYALSRYLRGHEPLQDLSGLLKEDEIKSLQSSQHVPNQLLLHQATELKELFNSGMVDPYQFVELEKTLTRLTNSMGGCERIKNTPFPQTYSRIIHWMVYAFAIFLPFGLVDVTLVGLVLTALTLAFGFLLIEKVAIYLQDPFSNQPSDTPMLALSRTIEINIRQMLGETELPNKWEPVDGVLY